MSLIVPYPTLAFQNVIFSSNPCAYVLISYSHFIDGELRLRVSRNSPKVSDRSRI